MLTCTIPGQLTAAFNGVPQAGQVRYFTDAADPDYRITYLPLGATRSQLVLSTLLDPIIDTAFHKVRVVSAGMRFFKTSKADSESGVLDIIYNRDGSSLDEGRAMLADIGRPKSDRLRCYIANTTDSIRGKLGFLAQANKRPHDERSFGFCDTDDAMGSDYPRLAYGPSVGPLFFMDVTTGLLYPYDSFSLIPAANQVAIVINSLQ